MITNNSTGNKVMKVKKRAGKFAPGFAARLKKPTLSSLLSSNKEAIKDFFGGVKLVAVE